MKNKISAILVVVFLSAFTTKSFAQDPNWSVNASNYQFSSTYTAFAHLFGANLTRTTDKIAAFVNGEIRGVGNVVYIPSADKHVVYLTIYANTNGETIDFKIYETSTNTVYDALQTSTFNIDTNIGSLFQSFAVSNVALNKEAVLDDFNFAGILPKTKTRYKSNNSTSNNTEDTYDFLLPKGTDITSLTPFYRAKFQGTVFVDGIKQPDLSITPSTPKDFTNAVMYSVLSQDETVVENYTINVAIAKVDGLTNALFRDVSKPEDIIRKIDIQFTELVTDFNTDVFVTTNSVVTKLTKVDDKNYQVELLPIAEGNFSLDIKQQAVLDADGFPFFGTNGPINFVNDEVAPSITSIELKEDNTSKYFEVVFSEPVINLGILDFELTGTLAEDYFIASQVNLTTNNTYRIDVSRIGTRRGSLFIKLKESSDISDISGNKIIRQETQSFFLENVPPIAITLPDITAECGVTVTDVQPIPTTTDGNSGILQIKATTKDPLTYSELGEYILNWDFTDVAGNITTVPQKIIITDTFLPPFGVLDVSAECSIVLEAPTRIDNCAGEITATTTDPIFYDLAGVYTVNWTLDDGNGNTKTVAQKVTIQDFTAPVSPTLETVRAIGSLTLIPPTTVDNCGEVLVGTTSSPLFYDQEGEYFVNWFFADKNGNGNNASQRVLVFSENPTAPVLREQGQDCSYFVFEPPRTEYINGEILGTTTDPINYPDQGEYEITWNFDYGNGTILQSKQKIIVNDPMPPEGAFVNDITAECSFTITDVPTAFDFCAGNVLGTTTDSLTYNEAGVYTVNWNFDDGNGNVLTVPQKITITDTVAPVAIVLPDVQAQCSVNLVAPKTTDNCVSIVTATTTDPVFYDAEGTYIVNWVFDDGNGNTTTATQNVIIDNNFAPQAPILKDIVAECEITVTEILETTANGCNGTIVASTTDTLTYNQQGEYIIVWNFDYGNGVVLQSNQKVIIKDTTSPLKPDLPTITSECAITITDIPTTTDNCGGVISGTTSDSLSFSFQGSYILNWTFNDGNGNTTLAQQRVIIKDATPPVAPVLPDITSNCEVLLTQQPTAIDNCDGVITGFTTDSFSFNEEGTFIVTWVFQDFSRNISTAQQRVIINNNTPPVTPILADILAECNTVVTTKPTTTDSCGVLITGKTTDSLVYDTQGEHIINWIFDDGKGNSVTVPQKVIVKDTVAPIIPILPDITDECAVTITKIPTTTDNCGGLITATTSDSLTYSSQGNHFVNWVFDDGNGNRVTAVQKVIIKDVTLPVVPVLNDISDTCIVNITNIPTTTDNCGGLITASTTDSLSYSENGNYIINWLFDDGNGNSVTVKQNINILDAVAPVAPVLEDVFNECSVILIAPTTTDNCGDIVIGKTINPTTYTTPGTYVVNWSFTDENGNSSSASQKVTVDQTAQPTAPVLKDIVSECSISNIAIPRINATLCKPSILGTTTDLLSYTQEGNYTITWNFDLGDGTILQTNQNIIIKDTKPPVIPILPDITAECAITITNIPTTTDNCSGIITATTTDVLTYTTQGNYVVNWIFTDKSGNSSTAIQKVIIRDTKPPEIPVLPTILGECDVVVLETPTAIDNCDGTVLGTTKDDLTYTDQGEYTITWIFTDKNGNTSIAKQKVIVKDTIAPATAILPNVVGECAATVTTAPTATDNCNGVITGVTSDSLTYTTQGEYFIIWTFTDLNGNTATSTQKVIVKNTTAPIIPVLADISGECAVTVTNIPTTTDNCGAIVTATTTDDLTYNKVGEYSINWFFNDGIGNSVTAIQKVIVSDTKAPIAPVLVDIEEECSVNITTIPTATDNCGGIITASTTDSLTYAEQGKYTVNWVFDDGNGNKTTAIQNVLIKDTTPPEAIILPELKAQCSINLVTPTTTDNCGGLIQGTTTDALFYDRAGTYLVNWIFNDGNGNTNTATQKITINNSFAPTAPVLADILSECGVTITNLPETQGNGCTAGKVIATTTDPLTYTEQGAYEITWSFNFGSGIISTTTQKVIIRDSIAPVIPVLEDVIAECSTTITEIPTTLDNCTGVINGVTTDVLSFTNQGEYTVTWNFTDANGNNSTANQKVIIKDTQAPTVANLPDVIGDCSVTISEIPTGTDNCNGIITGTTKDALIYTEQGNYQINWLFDDGNGNTITKKQNVIVNDTVMPTIIVKDIEVKLDVFGNASFTISDIDNGSFDNCAIKTYAVSQNKFTINDIGENTVVFSVTDFAGNAISENVKITVTQDALSTDSFTLDELSTYLYPNPSKNSIKISLGIEKANVNIYDMSGKLVQTNKNYISDKNIDISNLPIGVFIVRISNNNKLITKRLTKTE